jgi:DNA-binding NarL/FixJ family response regulator
VVNIVLIDQHTTYRESLKMVLEQIDGFHVVLDSSEGNWANAVADIPVHLMIIDGSMGKEKCSMMINHAITKWKSIKTLILAMYREELEYDYGKAEVMLKSSVKREFEEKIKKMMTAQKDCLSH